MNKNDLYQAIGGLEEETLDVKKSSKRPFYWAGGIAAMLVLVLGFHLGLAPKSAESSASQPVLEARPPVTLLAAAQYPEMTAYPRDTTSTEEFDAWFQSVRAQQRDPAYKNGLEPFWASAMSTFLQGDSQENKVCSPVNIYMALAAGSVGSLRQHGQGHIDVYRRADLIFQAVSL